MKPIPPAQQLNCTFCGKSQQDSKRLIASPGEGSHWGLETATIAVGVLRLLLNCKINPALLILVGAVIGVLSFTP
jgi:hypothetical protein